MVSRPPLALLQPARPCYVATFHPSTLLGLPDRVVRTRCATGLGMEGGVAGFDGERVVYFDIVDYGVA